MVLKTLNFKRSLVVGLTSYSHKNIVNFFRSRRPGATADNYSGYSQPSAGFATRIGRCMKMKRVLLQTFIIPLFVA